MSLQTVLADIDPGWFAPADQPSLDPGLVARARGSALGERILSRWLLGDGHAQALLAPNPEREVAREAVRWPRERLALLVRDLGVLAHAPAIRAEVGRDAVRRLKQALANSYLLALDRTVWDGRVEADVAMQLGAALRGALAHDDAGHVPLFALLDAQGRAELRARSEPDMRAIGEWALLLHPRPHADLPVAVLPAGQVRMLYDHHLGRARTP